MNRPYNTSFTNLGGINDYTHNPASQSEFSDIIGADPVWPAAYDIPLPKMPNPTIIEQDLYGWSPDSFSNSNGQTNGHDFADFAHDNLNLQSQPMYHSTLDGHLVGNPSSQSFVTLSSEGGERPDLITPPQETSPMLNLNQGVFGHRESDSSELAEDLDTIHLQQSHHGVDLYGAPNTTSATNPVSATGLATPEVSPDSTATKLPCTTGSDLASRRRRPKPLALQHDSMRSFSYAGSRTSSPQLRASPSASGKSSPVRRIKSTGNNLNIMAGRIAKPGTHSAQRSPRNYESCFQLVSAPDAHSSTAMNAGVPRISSADSNLFTPSSATLAQQPQASWVDGSSNAVPIAPAWAQNSHDFSPDVHAVASGFGLPPSPAKLGQHPPQSRFVYNCPPQSAPPHLASFFSDASPIMSAEAFNPTDWPTPSVTTPEHYGPDHHMPIPLRPDHALHHSHSGPVNFFDRVPHHSFSNGLPNIGPFQPYQPPFHSTPPAPKELDIKVECGPRVPSSHITQEVKAYTFNHSTPKDFSPATNSKK